MLPLQIRKLWIRYHSNGIFTESALGFLARPSSARTAAYSFSAIYCLATALSWELYHFHHDPARYPLFKHDFFYSDLLDYRGKLTRPSVALLLAHRLPVFNYLAPAAYLYSTLLHFADPVRTFVVVVYGAFLALLVASAVFLVRLRVFRPMHAWLLALLTVSYPMLVVLTRANLEGFVWIAVTCFILGLLFARDYLSGTALGLAMSIKPFPAIFLLLLFTRKKSRVLIGSLVLALLLNLAALRSLDPSISASYRALQPGLQLYTASYVRMFRPAMEMSYCHGLLDTLKMLRMTFGEIVQHRAIGTFDGTPVSNVLLGMYVALALGIFLITALLLRKAPLSNQIMGGCVLLTLLPPSCADYTLSSLYICVLLVGFYLIVEVGSKGAAWTRSHLLLLVCPLAALMAPLRCFMLWQGVVHCCLLILFLIGTVRLPLPIQTFARHQPAAAA